MLTRRSAIAAVLGSPLAAQSAMKEVSVGQISGAVNSSGLSAGEPCGPSPMWNAFRKYTQKIERKRDINRRATFGFHHSVAGKKSWSPAFKAHVQNEIETNEVAFWQMTEAEQAAFLIDRGISW